MADDRDSQAQAAADAATEDSIKVVCRFRPLNDTEEKTGSKFIIKFPSGSDDQCVSLSVRFDVAKYFLVAKFIFCRENCICLTKSLNQMLHKIKCMTLPQKTSLKVSPETEET